MNLFRKSGKLVILSVMVFILGLCTISIAGQQQASAAKEVIPPTVIEQKMLQKITLNYRDVPIDDILRAISEQVDLNIVKSPEITKTVTVSVTQVPLGEALNQILSAYDCGYVASENIIRVVPASQLTQETEKTVSKIYRVWYANVKEVEAAITKILTKRGTIAASIGTSNIIVTDTETNIKAIDSFLEEIDRPTPLIMVEVRIYDIKNTNALDLGVEWFAGRNTGLGTRATGGPITGSSNSNPYINGNFESTTKKVGSTGILDWGIITEHMDIETVFTAIQQQDVAKLLANPRIMVLDNETASFKAIEEIPYQQLQQGGYQSFGTTEFKEVGVELKVTPHLAKDDMIRLHVIPIFSVQTGDVEISTVGTGGATITSPQPIVDKREADTVALVKGGQTIVIGGLQKQTVNKLVSKVPLLGDIPVLKWIFTFEGEETANSELVVFITPRIVEQPVMTESEKLYLEGTEIPRPKTPITNLNESTGKLEIKGN
jgi:type IV pilus assembly protein PilQ